MSIEMSIWLLIGFTAYSLAGVFFLEWYLKPKKHKEAVEQMVRIIPIFRFRKVFLIVAIFLFLMAIYDLYLAFLRW